MATRPPAWLWALALGPLLLLVVTRWASGPGLGGEDFAQYILHARALAEGRPYGDTGFIWSHLAPLYAPAMRPPGVPLVLAGVFVVAGEHEWLVKLVMLAMTIVFLLVAGLYFARIDPWLGLGVMLLLSVLPDVPPQSTRTMSDLPFCMAVWLVLWLTDRPGPWTWRHAAAIAAAGLAAMAFRGLGILLVGPALLVAALRWKELRWKGIAAPLAWLAVLAAGAAVVGLPHLVAQPRFLRLEALVRNVPVNLLWYKISLADAVARPLPWQAAVDVYQILAVVPVIAGGLLWVRSAGRSMALWFALPYGALLLMLGFRDVRYPWPLYPLVLFALLSGTAWIARRLRPTVDGTAVALGAAAVIAVGAAVTAWLRPLSGSFAGTPDARALMAALRPMHAERPLRIMFARPFVLLLETGIPATPLTSAPPDTIVGELERLCITHMVVGSQGLFPAIDNSARRAVAAHPGRFEPVYANPSFVAYRFTGLPAGGCRPGARRRAASPRRRGMPSGPLR